MKKGYEGSKGWRRIGREQIMEKDREGVEDEEG